ncbi:hypothetical protein C8F01DRAFT_1251715 [Mycena amicta]|nr:hypothetical protein C8F01DRAFT_1251715 [Mycena amicta]
MAPSDSSVPSFRPASSPLDFPRPQTPPRTTGTGSSVHSTPRNAVPQSGVFTRAQVKKTDADIQEQWTTMLVDGFGGVVPLAELLGSPIDGTPAEEIKQRLKPFLEKAEQVALKPAKGADKAKDADKDKAKDVDKTKKPRELEDTISDPLVAFLKELVSEFPEGQRPLIVDTHSAQIDAIHLGEHFTRPDILCSRPGVSQPDKWTWAQAGLIIELKLKTDILSDSERGDSTLVDSNDAREALIQLGKSARSLLMAHGGVYVYVVAVLQHRYTRIFRFDHGGFKATKRFDWISEPLNLVQLFLQAYRAPPYTSPTPGRMDGDDDTISPATTDDKDAMWRGISSHPAYKLMFPAEKEDELKGQCLRITALVRQDDQEEVVDCLTVGPPLSVSDGLFSRATRVYRVVIKQHVVKNPESITVYALKDAWKQAFRRDEIDFYDMINHHLAQATPPSSLKEKEMAECHGTINLSEKRPAQNWNLQLHKTRTMPAIEHHESSDSEPKDSATGITSEELERCHVRSLITPVGRPLNEFPSTKAYVNALYIAVLHHEIACAAGVLHRDVSEGNILFDETTMQELLPHAFLVDYDYAEFFSGVRERFEGAFPDRKQIDPERVAKNLKKFTGTLPFMALEFLRNPATQPVHGPHHDLESIFWVLLWGIVRYTDHDHPDGDGACDAIFSSAKDKDRFFRKKVPLPKDSPAMQELGSILMLWVERQNPSANAPTGLYTSTHFQLTNPPMAVKMQHQQVKQLFDEIIRSPHGWASNDKAIPVDSRAEKKSKSEHNSAASGSRGSKRVQL